MAVPRSEFISHPAFQRSLGSADGLFVRESPRRNPRAFLPCYVRSRQWLPFAMILAVGVAAMSGVAPQRFAGAQTTPSADSPPASPQPTPSTVQAASPSTGAKAKANVGQPPSVEVWPGGPKREQPGPDAWEYHPYKVQVWLALEAVPELPSALRVDIERTLRDRTDVVFGATWDMNVAAPPTLFDAELLYRLERFPVDALVSRAKLGKLAAPPKKAAGAPSSGSQITGNQTTAGPTATAQATGGPANGSPTAGAQISEGQGKGGESSGGQPSASTAPAAEKAEEPPVDPLVDDLRRVFRGDKLIVATVRATADRWIVSASELDIKARRWGPLVQYDCFDLALVPDYVADAVHESFYPVALVNYGREKKVQLKIRAGRLATREDSPILLNEKSLLQPYLRSNDRYGEPKAQGGLQKMPWTFLLVKSRDASRIECEIHTGIRTSLVGRNTLRTERFALGVRPAGGATHLQLRTNEKPAQPLSGYDVYAKDPNSETTDLLGRTDWRGTMDVPYQTEVPLRLVYVKNGNSLLARLPLVPGIEPAMVVDLIPDDRRLQAEGFVAGMQNVITDLVARRELLTKRIRKKLEEQKFGEADELMNELKALETRDDVQRILDLQQPRMTATQPRVQQKIDKLFEDTRKLLYKFVDPNLPTKVQAELEQARTGGGGGGPIDVLNSPAPPPPNTGGAAPAPSTPAPSTPAPSAPAPNTTAPMGPAGGPPMTTPPAAPGGPPRPSGANVGTS